MRHDSNVLDCDKTELVKRRINCNCTCYSVFAVLRMPNSVNIKCRFSCIFGLCCGHYGRPDQAPDLCCYTRVPTWVRIPSDRFFFSEAKCTPTELVNMKTAVLRLSVHSTLDKASLVGMAYVRAMCSGAACMRWMLHCLMMPPQPCTLLSINVYDVTCSV